MDKIANESARSYLSSLPHFPKKDFFSFFVGANPNAIDLLMKLLDLDPDKRPTAEQALSHPYLAKYHDPEDEVTPPPTHTQTVHHPPSPPLSLSLSLSLSLCSQYAIVNMTTHLRAWNWK